MAIRAVKKQKTTRQDPRLETGIAAFANEFADRKSAVSGMLVKSSQASLANSLKLLAKATFIRASWGTKSCDAGQAFLHLEAEIGQSIFLAKYGIRTLSNSTGAKLPQEANMVADLSNLSFAKLPAVVLSNLKSESSVLLVHIDSDGLVFQCQNANGKTEMFFQVAAVHIDDQAQVVLDPGLVGNLPLESMADVLVPSAKLQKTLESTSRVSFVFTPSGSLRIEDDRDIAVIKHFFQASTDCKRSASYIRKSVQAALKEMRVFVEATAGSQTRLLRVSATCVGISLVANWDSGSAYFASPQQEDV